MTVRRVLAALAMVPWLAVFGQSRPTRPPGATGVPSDSGNLHAQSRDSMRPPLRYGIELDADPAGAVIERSMSLALSDAQLQALRTLRRWQQRRVRALADSLDRMNLPGTMLLSGIGNDVGPPSAGGPPGGPPAGTPPGGAQPGGGRTGRAGPGQQPGAGPVAALTQDQRMLVAPMLDSARAWTRLTRDSSLAILAPAQRDSLAAQWQRYRDSLPPGRRPGPPRP